MRQLSSLFKNLSTPISSGSAMTGLLILACLIMPNLMALAQSPTMAIELKVGSLEPVAPTHPLWPRSEETSYFLHRLLHEPLLSVDRDKQWHCVLCTEIPTVANGRIKTELTDDHQVMHTDWTIREDALWNDGTPISSQDFILGWNILKKALEQEDEEYYIENAILNVSPVSKDPKSFRITFQSDVYSFYQLQRFSALPSHLESKVWAASTNIKDYKSRSLYTQQPYATGLYSGAYAPVNTSPSWKLLINPYHFDQRSNLDAIKFLTYRSTDSLIKAVAGGQVNLLLPRLVRTLSSRHKDTVNLHLTSKNQVGPILHQVLFNLRNPILADSKVRRALKAAIDRETIVTRVDPSGIPASSYAALSLADPESFASSAAKPSSISATLLEEAGWRLNASQVYEKAGEALHITIDIVDSDMTRTKIAEAIKGSWESIGAQVTIVKHPPHHFHNTILRRAQFTGATIFSWEVVPDRLPRSMWHSSEIPNRENGYVGQNFGGWRNREVDELTSKYLREHDQTARKAIGQEIAKHHDIDVPSIHLYFSTEQAYVPDWLQGFHLTGHKTPASAKSNSWRHNVVISHPAARLLQSEGPR